jgi:predicted site-specific integrase-resolvase
MLGKIEGIVIAHKDRLARFGFDLFQWFCQQLNCQILVLNERSLSPEAKTVEDFLAIIHCFSDRLYGLRN